MPSEELRPGSGPVRSQASPPAIAASVWRVVGAPLVPATAGGPLGGQSVAVKDLFDVAGFAVGAGVPAFLAEAPPAAGNATAVDALLEAGATVTGIARTDEFAYSLAGCNSHYGTPPNGALVGAIPGGSSSGPASAVALGQASIGLGTDTGGSIRVPASYQGLWGLRTTHGSVSRSGLLPLSPSFDAVGWLTRDASTLAAAAAATLDVEAQGPLAHRFAAAPAFSAFIAPEVRDSFHAALEKLELDDLSIIDLGDLDDLFEIFRVVQASEAWGAHGSWIEAHPGALGDDIAARFAVASRITEQQSLDAAAAFDAARDRLEAVLGDRVLLLPSASSAAPSTTATPEEMERTRAGTLRLTCIAGLTGRPALSIPVMSVVTALGTAPVGLCLIGPRYTDLALVELGESLAATLLPARR
jgi:amidase